MRTSWAAFPAGLPDWRRHVLTDPQTSGGLLVACDADHGERLLARIVGAGYPRARIIGQASAGAPEVVVAG